MDYSVDRIFLFVTEFVTSFDWYQTCRWICFLLSLGLFIAQLIADLLETCR